MYRVSEKNRYTWFFMAVPLRLCYLAKLSHWIPNLNPLQSIHTQKYICFLANFLSYSPFKKLTIFFSCGPHFGIFGMPNVPNLIFLHCQLIVPANIVHRKKRNQKSDHASKSYSVFKVVTSQSSAAINDFFHNTDRTEKNDQILKNGYKSTIHWPNKAHNMAFES